MNETAENADALAHGKTAVVVIGKRAIGTRFNVKVVNRQRETYLLDKNDNLQQRLNMWKMAVVLTMMWRLTADVTGHLPDLMADITYHNQRSFENKMQIETSLDQKYWRDKFLKQ